MYFLVRLSVSSILSIVCGAIVVFAAKTLDELPNPPLVVVYSLMALGAFAIPFGIWHGLHRSHRVATTVRRLSRLCVVACLVTLVVNAVAGESRWRASSGSTAEAQRYREEAPLDILIALAGGGGGALMFWALSVVSRRFESDQEREGL